MTVSFNQKVSPQAVLQAFFRVMSTVQTELAIIMYLHYTLLTPGMYNLYTLAGKSKYHY